MSSIKLSPNASGTGEFTIAAPNSNTNRTLTLPDQTGTVLTNAGPFTANASASAGAVTIDASNNVGIGTSSPGTKLEINTGSSYSGVRLKGTSSASTGFEMTLGSNGKTGYLWNYENDSLLFATNNTERARIDSSGMVLIGTTSNPGGGTVSLAVSGTDPMNVNNSTAGTGSVTSVYFKRNATTVGTIAVTGSATAYNTSSDYRLKQDVAPMQGALARVAALKPVTYKWKVDGSAGEGFIAHELQAVVPDAVTGEKDAVDAEGNPIYQGIDTSFLVATLTAALQELNAKVAALEARLASDGPSNGGQA